MTHYFKTRKQNAVYGLRATWSIYNVYTIYELLINALNKYSSRSGSREITGPTFIQEIKQNKSLNFRLTRKFAKFKNVKYKMQTKRL